MKGVTRSFWSLVLVAGCAESYLVFLAVSCLHRVLPCWWSFVPHPTDFQANCGESVAIFGFNSWIPAAVVLVLFVITLLVACWTLISQTARTSRAIRQFDTLFEKPANLLEAERRLGTKLILVSETSVFCCCYGTIHRYVVISAGMLERLDADELAAVIAHELEHARRRDPTKALAIKVASRALFYLPLARHLGDQALVAAELGADDSAVSTVGRPALIRALLGVLGEVRPVLGNATEMASLDALDLRIDSLRTRVIPKVRPPLMVLVGSLLAAAAMWGLFVWLPHAPNGVVFHPVIGVIRRPPSLV
jgi:hypothetical protein